MPWVRKYPHSTRPSWIVGIIAGVFFGLLLGYERWGSTAAVVSVVEKELNATEARITNTENRLFQLEAKLLSQENSQAVMEGKGAATNLTNEVTQASSKSATDRMPRRVDTY
jgi:hypothetical protein